jgi:hypothetical protein
MLEKSKFNDEYRSPYLECAVNMAATASPKKTTSPGRNFRTSRKAAEQTKRQPEPQGDTHTNPTDEMTEDPDNGDIGTKATTRGVA